MKNIFRQGIYSLYFTCVEAGDLRLKERKSRLKPSEEKADREEGAPTKEKITPAEEQPPVKPEEPPVPVKEQAGEKPADGGAGKGATPVPKKQGKPEEGAKDSEEQQRKKNPGRGELEELRKDDSFPDIEDELDALIIEESLGGEAMDVKNYLKNRQRKKKNT